LLEQSGDIFNKGRKQQEDNAEEEKDKLYSL
jgi:hypothetical protein